MVTKRRPKPTRTFMLLLDPEDHRALHEVALSEKLTLADTVRRMIRAEHRKLQATKTAAA